MLCAVFSTDFGLLDDLKFPITNFVKTVTNRGDECIIFENFKFRKFRDMPSKKIIL